jgi:hypothetical protein
MGRLRKAGERSRRRWLIENNGISHCSYDDLTVVELARRVLTAPERAPSSTGHRRVATSQTMDASPPSHLHRPAVWDTGQRLWERCFGTLRRVLASHN